LALEPVLELGPVQGPVLVLVLVLVLEPALALVPVHSRQKPRHSPAQSSTELKIIFSLFVSPFFKI